MFGSRRKAREWLEAKKAEAGKDAEKPEAGKDAEGPVTPEVPKASDTPKEPQPIGRGVFGDIFDQFKGKVREAFDFLMKRKSGDLLGVFHREEIGDIDLVWGDREDNAGLDHIIDKHVGEGKDFANEQEMMSVIDDVVKNGKIIREKWDKVVLEKDGKRVVVRKNLRDKNGNIVDENKNWVVTSYDNGIPKSKKKKSADTQATPTGNQGGRAVAPDSSADKGSENSVTGKGNGGKKAMNGGRKKPGKFDAMKYAYPEEGIPSRPALTGTYHAENGDRVTTNTHIMVVEYGEPDPNTAGKIIGKGGKEISDRFPDYNRLVPRTEEGGEERVGYGKASETAFDAGAFAQAVEAIEARIAYEKKAAKQRGEDYDDEIGVKILGENGHEAAIAVKDNGYYKKDHPLRNFATACNALGMDRLSLGDRRLNFVAVGERGYVLHSQTNIPPRYTIDLRGGVVKLYDNRVDGEVDLMGKAVEPKAMGEEKLSITDESEREREEIARRAKADGTWMKAPDGTPTRLDERQWAEVRTAPFKDWFGDWERSKQKQYLLHGKTVVTLTGNEFARRLDKNLTEQVGEYFKSIGNKATSPMFGVVVLDEKGAEDSLAHGMGRNKAIAYGAVKDVIEKGVFIGGALNHKGRGYNTVVVAAPIIIGEERFVCAVVLHRNKTNNRFYLHEVTAQKNLQDDVFVTNLGQNPASFGDIAKLLKEIVTAKESSKIVGVNGEPLVVYHGTNGTETVRRWNEDRHDYDTEHSRFTVFRRRVDGLRNYGAFFNSSEDNAGGYGNEVYAVYLNMRNPLVIDCRGRSYSDIEHDGEVKDTYDWADYAERMGYDGVVFKNVRDGVDYGGMMTETDDYVVFRPNQIKSATENVGTFDSGKADIRFSIKNEETEKIFNAAKKKFGTTYDLREAGYVLPDGSMLDFSGRHELDSGTDSSFLKGQRTTDHRQVDQISFVYDENGNEVETGVRTDMGDFIGRGAIRIDASVGAINLSQKPTQPQRDVLRRLIARNGGDVMIDFGNGWDRNEHYVEYEKAKPARVLSDIDKYFDEGIKPQGDMQPFDDGSFSIREMSDNELDREYKRALNKYNAAKLEGIYGKGVDVRYADGGVDKEMRLHTPTSAVERITPTAITPHSLTRDDQKDLYKSFKPETNDNTGERVEFYNSAFDKNHREGGLFEKIVPQIPELFKTSMLAYSEQENLAGIQRPDGTTHKEHRDVSGYGNYLNKVMIDGKEYYVRFTVQRKKNESGLHSSFVSNVELYDNPAVVAYGPSHGRRRLDNDRIVDAKLRTYFEKAKENEEKLSALPENPEIAAKQNRLEAQLREILVEAARRKGYSASSDYQGTSAFNGAAPARNAYYPTREERVDAFEKGEFEDTFSLGDFMETGIDGWDLSWQLDAPQSFLVADASKKESIANLRDVVNGNKKTVKMYRSVPTSVREGRFRNGDWITPSRLYAEKNAEIHGWDGYRIIEQEVSVNDVWWDGNDINEWGYDDGRGYVYKNTENNRKLLDLVTRDDNGNVIPLSRRFDAASEDIRFSYTGKRDEEVALRDALVERLRGNGVEVITDDAEGQRIMDGARRANELLTEMKKRNQQQETVVPGEDTPFKATVVSSADGTKVLQNLELLANESENLSIRQKNNFIANLAKALDAHHEGSDSQYADFETVKGNIVTIRLADHNATVSNFDYAGRKDGISIVISRKPDTGIVDDGNAHIVEFYYSDKILKRADDNVYAQIVRSIQQALYSGEYKDTTGLAKPHEVNGDILKEMRVWHGTHADFDAFDHSHMGEGEGAQAYGWGTYVTQVDGVARGYAGVNGEKITYQGKLIDTHNRETLRDACLGAVAREMVMNGKTAGSYINEHIESLERDVVRFNQMIAEARSAFEKGKATKLRDGAQEVLNEFKSLNPKDFTIVQKRYLYEVEIPDNDGSNYLAYDEAVEHGRKSEVVDRLYEKLLSEDADGSYDSDAARKGLADELRSAFKSDGLRGSELYGSVSAFLGGDRAASEFLHECGFVGIEYPTNYRSGGNERGDKNYVIFNEADAKIVGKTRFFRTADGEVYGYAKDGKIYIDPRIATAETPVHEYSHLWAEALRQANPTAWRKLVAELRNDKDLTDYVGRLYPELEGDELWEEIFAHYSGRRGAARLRAERDAEMAKANGVLGKARIASMFNKLARALRKFWNMSRRLFAGNNAGLDKMNVEDFADMALADMLEKKFSKSRDVIGDKKDNIRMSITTATAAGDSRQRAIEAIGGEAVMADWLKAAAVRRHGATRGASMTDETRSHLHAVAAGRGYDPEAVRSFRQTLINGIADDAATMNVTPADVRLAMFEATKAEKGGWRDIVDDINTERQLRAEAEASHDEVEDVLSQELKFSLFGKRDKNRLFDFSYLNYGLNDADLVGLTAVRDALRATPLAAANRRGLGYRFTTAIIDEMLPIATFIKETYGLASLDEAYIHDAERNPYLAENTSRSRAQTRVERFRREVIWL